MLFLMDVRIQQTRPTELLVPLHTAHHPAINVVTA
jgi:hypothetical protein